MTATTPSLSQQLLHFTAAARGGGSSHSATGTGSSASSPHSHSSSYSSYSSSLSSSYSTSSSRKSSNNNNSHSHHRDLSLFASTSNTSQRNNKFKNEKKRFPSVYEKLCAANAQIGHDPFQPLPVGVIAHERERSLKTLHTKRLLQLESFEKSLANAHEFAKKRKHEHHHHQQQPQHSTHHHHESHQQQQHLHDQHSHHPSHELLEQIPEPVKVECKQERQFLELLELQRKVRLQVLSTMPAKEVLSNTYRSRRDIENEHKRRERTLKQQRAKEDKEAKKNRRAFLTAVLSHGHKFALFNREMRRSLKKSADSIVNFMEEQEKKRFLDSKQAEKERLAALRANDEEEYLRLLKKAKNERLLTLIRQTDQYMQDLGAHIQEEQQRMKRHINGDSASVHPMKQYLDDQQKKKEEGKNEEGGEKKDEVDEIILSRKRYYGVAHAVQEEVSQPKALVAGELRSYQVQGLKWMVSLYNNQLNGILADEMGLGKTVQTCALIAYLMEYKQNYGPFLIIVPMSTLHNNWEFEFDRWFPSCQKVLYDGDKEQRKRLRDRHLLTQNYNVLMTTFEFAMRDKAFLRKINWEYIIIDEAHRLKNPKCKLALELATYPKTARRIALTGTPLQNELPELWSLLNFLHPTIFNSSEQFEKWFSSPFTSTSNANSLTAADKEKLAMTEEEKLLVINRLHAILRPFMLRREKKEVETDLADKVEKVVRCSLTSVQKLLYEYVLEGYVNLHNRMVQLRKVCNHPYLFHPYLRNMAGTHPFPHDEDLVRICGKFAVLDSMLAKLKRTGHRVLIFNQMTKSMDILEDYFNSRKYTYLRLDGTTGAEQRRQYLELYNAPDSPYFIFMLSTKAGGLGLNLQSADTVILYDSDWNPQNDLQAQARAHRIGQKNQVVVLRLVTTGTVEEKVLSTAQLKLNHEQMVIQAGMFHERYSHQASRNMVERAMREKVEGDEDISDEDEICKLLARNEDELAIYQEMDRQAAAQSNSADFNMGNMISEWGPGEVAKFPEDMIPRWVYDWALYGNRSMCCDTSLVPFSPEKLVQERIGLMDPIAAQAAWAEHHAKEERAKRRLAKQSLLQADASPSPLPSPLTINDLDALPDKDPSLDVDDMDVDDDAEEENDDPDMPFSPPRGQVNITIEPVVENRFR